MALGRSDHRVVLVLGVAVVVGDGKLRNGRHCRIWLSWLVGRDDDRVHWLHQIRVRNEPILVLDFTIRRLIQRKHFFDPGLVLVFLVHLLDHCVLIDGFSAVRAVDCAACLSKVIDQGLVAVLVELVRVKAGQLNDLVSLAHRTVANAAFASSCTLHRRVDCAAKSAAGLLDHRLVGRRRVLLVLEALRVGAHKRQSSVVLELFPADGVVLEVVEAAELVLDEVKTDDAVLELLTLLKLLAFVAAAGEQRVDEEDGDARQHKHRVLDHVQNQVDVEVGGVRVRTNRPELALGEIFLPLVFLGPHQGNGRAEEGCLDDPLAESPGCEAPVTARLVQETVADGVIDAVVEAQAEGHALHLAVEANVDQQVVVQQVEQGQDTASDDECDGGCVIVCEFFLGSHQVDEPD